MKYQSIALLFFLRFSVSFFFKLKSCDKFNKFSNFSYPILLLQKKNKNILKDVLRLCLDEKVVLVDKLELHAVCEEDPSLEESITHSIHRLYGAIMPIPTQTII